MSDDIDFRQLVEASGDAIIVADREERIVLWNPAAERIFGFSAAEALGQPLALITPERFRARHGEGYARTMETGVTRYGTTLLRVPALGKGNVALSIAFTVSLLRNDDGSVRQIVAIIRDETARWSEERALRLRLRTLEDRATD